MTAVFKTKMLLFVVSVLSEIIRIHSVTVLSLGNIKGAPKNASRHIPSSDVHRPTTFNIFVNWRVIIHNEAKAG